MLGASNVGRVSTRPLIVLVIIAAVLIGWITWKANPGARRFSRAAVECKTRYTTAKSFADTAKVDGTYPTEYAQEFSTRSGPDTCGQLRRRGALP
jgi:hypothetical protein